MCLLSAAVLAHVAVAASLLALPAPLAVDFSAPVEGEADVRLDTRMRIQFSKDVDTMSLKDRVRVTYSQADSRERGEAQPPRVVFITVYDPGTRVLHIRPAQRFERFRQVKVDLLEGIVATDGSALEAWTLNFTTGGS